MKICNYVFTLWVKIN